MIEIYFTEVFDSGNLKVIRYDNLEHLLSDSDTETIILHSPGAISIYDMIILQALER